MKKNRKVYLVRHAPTPYNGSPDEERIRSVVDIPLDEEGLHIANDTGINLRKAGIECVYTSEMKRAKQTAKQIYFNSGGEIEAISELNAWNLGSLAGKKTKDVQDIMEALVNNPNLDPPDSDESFRLFQARTLTGYYISLLYDGTIAIVTHYSNCRVILEHLGCKDCDMEPGEYRDITQ